MVKNLDSENTYETGKNVLNYYVQAIVYEKGKAKFYINGNYISELPLDNSTSKLYFAAVNDKGTIYGGSLIRFKQFAFVDGVHTSDEIKSNSEWLYNNYLK